MFQCRAVGPREGVLGAVPVKIQMDADPRRRGANPVGDASVVDLSVLGLRDVEDHVGDAEVTHTRPDNSSDDGHRARGVQLVAKAPLDGQVPARRRCHGRLILTVYHKSIDLGGRKRPPKEVPSPTSLDALLPKSRHTREHDREETWSYTFALGPKGPHRIRYFSWASFVRGPHTNRLVSRTSTLMTTVPARSMG